MGSLKQVSEIMLGERNGRSIWCLSLLLVPEAVLSVQQFTPPRITPAVSLSPVSSKLQHKFEQIKPLAAFWEECSMENWGRILGIVFLWRLRRCCLNALASCLSKQGYASSAPFPVRDDAGQAERCCLKY